MSFITISHKGKALVRPSVSGLTRAFFTGFPSDAPIGQQSCPTVVKTTRIFFIVMFLCCVATESFLQVARTLTGPLLSAAGRNLLVICLSAPFAILAGSAVLAKTACEFRCTLLRALGQ
ncbi:MULTISPECIES: hypothetical protein [unclassified Megasphaera]|uniref:hypothetical protein n=1 Tax=unclassified Megasphaera TaxID=2626256 RepID=UPI0025BE6834|nr:hypothetical protein [Megasphaera sp. UBA4233]